jgi:hypothetical protein
MTAAPSSHSPATTTAAPPRRFWWLKRLSFAFALLFALLLALRLWWGHVAQRRIDQRIATAQAAGEPVLPSDFIDPDKPADAENAAVAFGAAAMALKLNQAQSAFDARYDPDIALSESDRKLLAGIVAGNIKALALSRHAATLPHVDWGVRYTTPLLWTLLPHLSPARRLASFLRYAAIDHHLSGMDGQTVEDLRDTIREGDDLDRGQPVFLVTHLVSIAINSLATDTIARYAGELQIDTTTAGAAGATTTAQVRVLIDQLLDDQTYRKAAAGSWYEERLIGFDEAAADYIINRTPQHQWWLWPIRPMFRLDAVRLFDWYSAVAAASSEASLPMAMAKMPALPPMPSPSPLRRMSRLYESVLTPAFAHATQEHYHQLALRRIAAVLLAARLYEGDHEGAPPPNLAALVPAYLPSIPLDPLAPGSQPLRYVSTPMHEAVYSVGDDGVDDGGKSPGPHVIGPSRRLWPSGTDIVIPLHPPPPPKLPGSSPGYSY